MISAQGRENKLGIIVHDESHAAHVEAVGFGHHSFTPTISDVVGAHKCGEDSEKLDGNESESNGVPMSQCPPLELEIWVLAPGENGAGIAEVGHTCLDERGVVAAAVKLVLDTSASERAKISAPLSIDLSLEVERPFLVGDVSWGDEECKEDPEKEIVDGKEAAIVKENAGRAEERCDDADGRGDGREDELGPVANADDVSVVPDVEPGDDAEDEASESVDRNEEV